jgi:hypothetical protein
MYRSRRAQQKALTQAALLWPAADGPQWLSAQLPGTPLPWSWAGQEPSAAQKSEQRYDRTSAKVNSEGSACCVSDADVRGWEGDVPDHCQSKFRSA